MELRILTIAFDDVMEGFPDEVINEFCINKEVLDMQAHFFQKKGQFYWSVAIRYKVVLDQKDRLPELDETQKKLYDQLRIWRKEQGAKEGFPVYLIATNAQLVQMVRLSCKTLESFKSIKGFGKKRVEKYGKQINNIIKAFFEEK